MIHGYMVRLNRSSSSAYFGLGVGNALRGLIPTPRSAYLLCVHHYLQPDLYLLVYVHLLFSFKSWMITQFAEHVD